MDYTVVIEKGVHSVGGYALDIEGIYAFGDTEQDVLEKLQKAIADRIGDLRAEGREIPQPTHSTSTIHVAA